MAFYVAIDAIGGGSLFHPGDGTPDVQPHDINVRMAIGYLAHAVTLGELGHKLRIVFPLLSRVQDYKTCGGTLALVYMFSSRFEARRWLSYKLKSTPHMVARLGPRFGIRLERI